MLGILGPLVPSTERRRPAAEQFAPYRKEIMALLEDPARPGRPRDKGKVERTIRAVRDLFRRLKALDPSLTLAEVNKKGAPLVPLRKWPDPAWDNRGEALGVF